jgi:hypothetical protein
MKYLGIFILVLALVIGILPQFTECKGMLELANGLTTHMKCHWTAMAELGMAIPLAAAGVLLFLSKRKETRQYLSVVGAILGIIVVLLPTTLIGVCANEMMTCRNLMFPALVLCGILVVAACVVLFAASLRMDEPGA